jgi:hypothetical protein
MKDRSIDDMRSAAIFDADKWVSGLTEYEQIMCFELASRAASQSVVMFADGDRRRGFEVFPDAWRIVRNPPLKAKKGE